MTSREKILELLNRAVECIEWAGVERFSFGGGSALALLYSHRESRDVDVFLSDPQYLPGLSPRLNDRSESVCVDYVEASNFVRLVLQDGRKIDFIVAPNLTGYRPVLERGLLAGRVVPVEHPIEITAKKLFYRTEGLKYRDLIDLLVVVERFGAEAVSVWNELMAGRKKLLEERITKLLVERDPEKLCAEYGVRTELAEKMKHYHRHPEDLLAVLRTGRGRWPETGRNTI